MNIKQFTKGKEQDMAGSSNQNIYQNNPQKQERYNYFVWEKEGKILGGIPPATVFFLN